MSRGWSQHNVSTYIPDILYTVATVDNLTYIKSNITNDSEEESVGMLGQGCNTGGHSVTVQIKIAYRAVAMSTLLHVITPVT